MKRFWKYQLLWKKNEKIHFGMLLIGTLFTMFFMISIILSNTYQLEEHLESYAESYSGDVSEQLVARITTRFKQRANDIRNLAESFQKIPDEILTEELINQKKKALNVSHLFIVNEDGSLFPPQEKIPDLYEYLSTENAIDQSTHISFLDQNQVIYSTPFYKDGSLKLLVSTCYGKMLQEMLEDFNYEDKGRCCIINKKGQVIIAPSDMRPFQMLSPFLNADDLSEDNTNALKIMKKDIELGKSDWAIFQDVNNHDLIVGYDFLGICDWMLLTILPHNLFSNTIKGYTAKFIFVGIALILITIYIIFAIVKIYRKNMLYIKKAALTDPLTLGDNDTAFRLKGEYTLKKYTERTYALIYLNNKDFKSYNTRFGIKGANKILCNIYHILKQHLTDCELLSRCDGTSFYLLLTYDKEAMLIKRIRHMEQEIKQHLYSNYGIENYNIAQGGYLIPKHSYDFIQMQDWAKIASTHFVLEDGCKIFDDSIVQLLLREQELDESFEKALQNHEFKLYIQPKVCPKQNKILSGEVLVRWEHPVYGLIPPNEFIPLFEKNGKICKLDLYMFEETCKLLNSWITLGKEIPLSVNLSRAHLGSHNFAFLEHFQQLKEHYHIPDRLIELELTESIILERQEVPFVLEVMNKIQAMGFLCSLDDFGFGYSSLTLLKDLNINIIKLDRQFFLNETNNSWIVIKKLIQMAHELHISVVAEGIESWEQVEKLASYDCDLIQGFIYARPMDSSSFISYKL